ncbi:MAG TPA: glycosyltransferase family protein, partial [Polyangiaceae bacterium]
VQARTTSTRLPGKVLKPLAGKPLLSRMLERLRAAETPFELVVATTVDRSDDAIVELCAGIHTSVFRGHPSDLLDRHLQAARQTRAETIVKIPSDCPLIAPEVVDRVLDRWNQSPGSFDYLSNLHPPTYPDGNDVEVMTREALEIAWIEARKPHEREHTTPFLWDQPERFRIGNVAWETGLNYSLSHRFTIDYEEDYQLISAVYDALCTESRPVFSLSDILDFISRRPDVLAFNAQHRGVSWYRHHLSELRTRNSLGTVKAPA